MKHFDAWNLQQMCEIYLCPSTTKKSVRFSKNHGKLYLKIVYAILFIAILNYIRWMVAYTWRILDKTLECSYAWTANYPTQNVKFSENANIVPIGDTYSLMLLKVGVDDDVEGGVWYVP